ncbi:MAG: hypothetical protein JWP57_3696, partial [Spirosoma sp.]|nr:hypothetical protein [Spirosoma sp.]
AMGNTTARNKLLAEARKTNPKFAL